VKYSTSDVNRQEGEASHGRSLPLETAPLHYASLGWPVFPVQGFAGTGAKVKQPLRGSRGFKDASSDPKTVSRAFRPGLGRYGIGLATGAGLGLWVLDIDGEEGAVSLASLTDRHGRLPDTLTGRTGGGGWHLFFRMPADRDVRNSESKLAPKIDVRGSGGYVVLPPSPHPSGRSYEWLRGRGLGEIEPATAPGWLLELAAPSAPSLLTPAPSPSEDASSPVATTSEEASPPVEKEAGKHVDTLEEDWPAHGLAVFRKQLREVLAAQVGSRRRTLAKASLISGRLVANGSLSEPHARKALTQAGRFVGLPEEEIEQTIRSGIATGKGGHNA